MDGLKDEAPTRGAGKRVSLGLAAATAAFACALFTACAAGVLLLASWRFPELAVASLRGGLVLRVVLFGTLAGASGYAVVRLAARARRQGSTGPSPAHDPLPRLMARPRFWLALVLAVVPATLVSSVHLHRYPWAAPDETHHLNVAKNLAEHGRYASGSGAAGLRDFDPYDSVGPPVIVPVAGVFRAAGTSLAGARAVMAGYLGLFLLLVYIAFVHEDSQWAAACAALFAFMSFGSVYLGRTLYGEVPALAWLLLGLLLWRRGWQAERSAAWSLGAGLAFGLAVLCKTIFLLAAFPLLAVALTKALLAGRCRATALVLPALGVAVTVGAWWAAQAALRQGAPGDAGATLGLYQHYLLFGLEPAWDNLRSFTEWPWMNLVALYTAVVFGAVAFGRGGSLVVPALLTFSLFFFYWWVFFTPGQLPRYQWPAYAPLGMMGGMIFAYMARVAVSGKKTFPRAAAAVTALLVAMPYGAWSAGQVREVLTNREMEPDHAVAAYVEQLPAATPVSTTFYPLAGTLRFLCGREAAVVEDGADAPGVVIERRETDRPGDVARFGPYAVRDNTGGVE